MVFLYWNFTNGKRLVDVLIHNTDMLKTNWYAFESFFFVAFFILVLAWEHVTIANTLISLIY